jgi:hypothetical protein
MHSHFAGGKENMIDRGTWDGRPGNEKKRHSYKFCKHGTSKRGKETKARHTNGIKK